MPTPLYMGSEDTKVLEQKNGKFAIFCHLPKYHVVQIIPYKKRKNCYAFKFHIFELYVKLRIDCAQSERLENSKS